MAIIVQDNFNRTNDPTSLGTATTGQVWSQSVADVSCTFGIVSNQAKFNAPSVTANNSGQAWIEANTEDAIVKVTLENVASLPNFASYVGITGRRESSTRLYRLIFRNLGTGASSSFVLRLEAVIGAGVFNSIGSATITPANGDTIALGFCGDTATVFYNDVEQFTASLVPFNIHGTFFGLTTAQGTIPTTFSSIYDDFSVETFGTCTPTYNCTESGCVDPGDGTGTYATLEACLTACSIAPSYNCVDGVCIDPGDGTGTYTTLLECQQSGCANLQAETQKFDAGNGSKGYLVAQLSDSGDELRSKNYKAVRGTGIKTNASVAMYGYDVNQEIDVAALEDGTRPVPRMTTQPQQLTDSTSVSQSERKPINVTNAVLGTVRYEFDDRGKEQRDQIHEIVIEQDIQGVRR